MRFGFLICNLYLLTWHKIRVISIMKIHFIGIGGIGTSALAKYYLSQGHKITGSDLSANWRTVFDTQELKLIKFYSEHNENNLAKNTDLVIYTAAINKDNPELKKAKKIGIKCLSYAQALGELTKKFYTIAVSGMHGKSTTTAMIAAILIKAGLDPTIIVGSKVNFNNAPINADAYANKRRYDNIRENQRQNQRKFPLYTNFRLGRSPNPKLDFRVNPRLDPCLAGKQARKPAILVIEADEFDRSFLNYWPEIIVLTNIEEEHLDCYKDLNDIIQTFKKYINHLPKKGILVANKDDKNIIRIIQNLRFKVQKYSPKIKPNGLKLKIPGWHNISNAMAALIVARALDISDKISIAALNNFNGIWRRFEYKGTLNGAKIYDDYGHHPTEITATLAAAAIILSKNGKLYLVFQPHQYHRTYKLFRQFKKAFNLADKIGIMDIYSVAGREDSSIKKQVNSQFLVESLRYQKKDALYLPSFEKAEGFLKYNLKKNDLAIIMGAGDIWRLTESLLNRIHNGQIPK